MRYEAVEGSQHECCFDAHVYDNQKQEVVCECRDLATAQRIAHALNRTDL